MEDKEREYWCSFPYAGKEYTVGADLFSQGLWHLEEDTGRTYEDESPSFYKYVAYVGEKEAKVTPDIAALADLILCNIYWQLKGV